MLTIQRHISLRGQMLAFLAILFLCNSAWAQEGQSSLKSTASSPLVTATATVERVRFTAPNAVAQLRLEVYAEMGQKLFDTELRGGSVVDWHLQDGAGVRVAAGQYACLLTVRSLSGRISQKLGLVTVDEKTAAVRTVVAAALNVQQAEAVGPLEGNTALTILGEQEPPAATVITHDGTDAQLTRTRGALSFRTGDFFSGNDAEQMRLTEEGNLGLGTDNPQARLDVNGMIRARSGFQFADGTVLNLAEQGGGLRVTLPSGAVARLSFTPDAVNGTAHFLPRFAADGNSLIDSALYQDPNTGFIGWGTTTPAHPFVVRRNGASLGVHSIGELFVDRDDRNRSASLTVGTAGALKWIFGMPFGSDGFQVFDLTNNVSRFFVDPASGGIGLGTTTPTAGIRLEVNGITRVTPGGSGGFIQFGTPNSETGMVISGNSSNSRADVRFDGTTLKLVAVGGGFVPPNFNGIAIDTSGNVSIGVQTMLNNGKLEVHNSNRFAAIYGVGASSTGVFGSTDASSMILAGVHGRSFGTGGVGVRGTGTTGVYGDTASNGGVGVRGEVQANDGVGVLGTATTGIGVKGTSNTNVAVLGESSYIGVYGKSTGDVGVYGESNSNSGSNAGIYGHNTAGGFSGFFSGKVQVSGQLFVLGGCSGCSPPSDRNLKANFSAVNPRLILNRLARLPIQTWNYKTEAETVRHIGPMAQDFHAAFNFGDDAAKLNSVDANGVTMAAIQGLYQLIREQEQQIRRLKVSLRQVERRGRRRRK